MFLPRGSSSARLSSAEVETESSLRRLRFGSGAMGGETLLLRKTFMTSLRWLTGLCGDGEVSVESLGRLVLNNPRMSDPGGSQKNIGVSARVQT